MTPYRFAIAAICVPMEANAQIIIIRTINSNNNQNKMTVALKI